MRSEAQRLEALAERLRAVEPMTPSPVAKIRAWNLVAASIEQSTSVRAPARSPWRLALAAAAAVALLVAGGVAASANSLPDSPLYPAKGALERAEGVLAFSPSDRLTYHLNLAQTRLTEAEAMIAGHRLDLAEQALADMNQELDDAAAVVSGERDMPAVAADMENRLQQAITAHDQQLAGMQAEVTNPTAQQAIAKARDRANQSLQALTVNPGNDNQANPSGQGQGQGSGKGPASPHPTAKK
ncbi:MAG TPA: DUF5667 domain-containing protein [Candidatus Dormibacteraeota bacterium]